METTQEESLRVTALSFALNRARDGEKPEETVKCAEVFLAFLKPEAPLNQ